MTQSKTLNITLETNKFFFFLNLLKIFIVKHQRVKCLVGGERWGSAHTHTHGRMDVLRNLLPDWLRAADIFHCERARWLAETLPSPALPAGCGMLYSGADTPSMLSQHFITPGLNSTHTHTHTEEAVNV